MKKQKINQSDAARRLKKALKKRRRPSAILYATDTRIISIFKKAFTILN